MCKGAGMRILMLAQFYPPAIGGEERHVRNLALALAERGHDVSVATLRHGDAPAQELDNGVRVHRIRGTMQRISVLFSEQDRQYAPPFPDPELALALREIILAERPDILHAHNWIIHSVLPLKVLSKAKLVLTLHDYSLVCVQQRLTYHNKLCTGPAFTKCVECAADFFGMTKGVPTLMTNWVGSKVEDQIVDMFLPVSQAVAEGTQLASRHVPYQVVPNFVPDNIAQEPCTNTALVDQLPKEPYMLFVGDVKRDKGVEVLLQAYEKLQRSIPLVLIGKFCNDLSVTIPPNVVVFPGWPHDAVMEAWRRCIFAITPSIWHDPCPTVAMEAMAVGRPVIASRIGGLSDIVRDGETGLLVPPGDIQALYEAMLVLSEHSELREQMGKRAKEHVANFQAGMVVARIEHVYQEVLQHQRETVCVS